MSSSEPNTPEVRTVEDAFITEYEATKHQGQSQEQEQSPVVSDEESERLTVAQDQPIMSPEQTLLLQVLRRAKRQQDLIIQVIRSLKVLATIEKSMAKTTVQVKQLQSALKDTQKLVMQAQHQIAIVERAQERNYQKLAKQKNQSAAMKSAKAGGKTRKPSSKKM